jgi:alpha 1,6-mannosyltransferase
MTMMQLLLDAAADKLIRETFEEVPDVIDLWTSFPKPVLRADLFRYLITYAFGGM